MAKPADPAGASISPRTRLIGGLIVAIAGAGLAAIGVASTWYIVTVAGTSVDVPDVGRALLLGEAHPITGTSVAGGATLLVVVALLAAGLSALAGRRARVALLGVVIVTSLGAIASAAMVDAGDARAAAPERVSRIEPGVTKRFGRELTMTGAAFAIVGAGFSLPIANKVARVPMPERAPAPEDGP